VLKIKLSLDGLAAIAMAIVTGFLLMEVVKISSIIAGPIAAYLFSPRPELVIPACLASAAILILFLYLRDIQADAVRIIKGYRLDLFLGWSIGAFISVYSLDPWSRSYQIFVRETTPQQLMLITALPLLVACILIMQATVNQRKKERSAPFFISDAELKDSHDDLLGIRGRAESFAGHIFNGGSSDSLVFGIDAPWGIGKSTFVNFCIQYWERNHAHQVIVYRFNPLQYENRNNLLEKFVDGLIEALKNEAFIPELRPILARYSRLIQAKDGFTFSGFKFNIFSPLQSVDHAFQTLETALGNVDKKIIVVVDDLDRLPATAVEDILFTIKASFTLPNISYVLCYDTDNISIRDTNRANTEKIKEFLEKFVNVKISLFLDSEVLAKFISQNLEIAVKNNPQIDPYTLEKIKETISSITDICRSPDFHRYQPLFGDIRKIKRLINTVLLFQIENTDFTNSDFNKHDLLHLLLVYINYPNIFRKIYTTETNGQRGFFSVVSRGDDGYFEESNNPSSPKDRYKNSIQYNSYVSTLAENPQFLLNKLFLCSGGSSDFDISDNEKVPTSSACFNGSYGTGRNLEQYLQLIVKQSKPTVGEHHQYYLNKKQLVIQGEQIGNVLNDVVFAFERGEAARQRFWRVIVNTGQELGGDAGRNAITYLLEHAEDYSHLEIANLELGMRDDIAYFLIKLLDTCGWIDPQGRQEANTPDNIAEIAEWIFGEARHKGGGVIATLGSEKRGPLGLHDLMVFRLYCCADRGGEAFKFNLTRAIALHHDPNAPTAGVTTEIAKVEMREMSQKIFRTFVDQYVTPGRNLFELIDLISLDQLTGKYNNFLKTKVESGAISSPEIEKTVRSAKSRMKGFIAFNLENKVVNSGIGCGFYDLEGSEDRQGIASAFNDYLFDQCFHPDKGDRNYEHFLIYIMINYGNRFSFEPHFFYMATVLFPVIDQPIPF